MVRAISFAAWYDLGMAAAARQTKIFKHLLMAFIAALCALLLVGGFVASLGWAMSRGFRLQREKLIAAFTTPEARRELIEWSEPFLGQRRLKSLRMPEGLPPAARRAGVNSVDVFKGADGRIISIEFGCSGADNHYGIVVGISDPPECIWPLKRRLSERVWFFDELDIKLPPP